MLAGRDSFDLMNIVLAGGTRRLNKDFKSSKSSMFNYFNRKENMDIEDGNGRQYTAVVEDENVKAYHSGSIWPTNEVDILNQWKVPLRDMVANTVLEGTKLSRLLGGWSMDSFMNNMSGTPMAPKADFPTLINELEAKLWNIQDSFNKKYSKSIFHKMVETDKAEWPDGLDVIMAPDAPYGGKKHTDLGQQDWPSALLSMGRDTPVYPYRHNPLHKDFGGNSFPTLFGDFNAACADISKGRADVSDANDPERLEIIGVCGVMTQARMAKLLFDQRAGARYKDDDTNIGITKPIHFDLWGLTMYADHYCPEDTIYIWAKEAIKTIKQTGDRGTLGIRKVRLAFAEDKLMIPYTVECNFGCSARWQTCVFTGVDYEYTGDIVGFNS